MRVFHYQLLGFSGDNLVYQDNIEKQQKTEDIENFIANNHWQEMNEVDKKTLWSYIRQKKINTVEGFKIPLGPVSFNTVFGLQFLPVLVGLMTVVMIITCLTGSKWIQIFGHTIGGGIIICPIAFIFLDTINEIYGYKQARISVYTCAFFILVAGALIQFCLTLPNAPYNKAHMDPYLFASLFHTLPFHFYTTAAALLIADTINVIIFQTIKHYSGVNYLWLRSFVSNAIGQFMLSFFYIIFFYGWTPMIKGITGHVFINSYFTKMVILIALIPVLYLLVYTFRNIQSLYVFSGPKSVNTNLV